MKRKKTNSRRAGLVGCVVAAVSVCGIPSPGVVTATEGPPIDDGIVMASEIAELEGATSAPKSGPGYTLLDGWPDIPASSRPWRIWLTPEAEQAGLRPVANAAAADFTAATAVTMTVDPGTFPSNKELTDETILVTSSTTYCDGWPAPRPDWRACGGPTRVDIRELGTYITGGKVTIKPGTTDIERNREALDHEIGHVFGLGHYEDAFEGQFQLMHSERRTGPGYKSGDRNGLLYKLRSARTPTPDSSIAGFVVAAGEKMDFDGDGTSDVFTRRGDGSWWYSPGGAGSWRRLSSSDARFEDLRFGDFDGDGRTDVFTVRTDGVWVFRKAGRGEWLQMARGASLTALRFGDFDGDGKTDVFTVRPDGRWQYSPSGHLSWKVLGSGASLTALRFGDFDGDGKTDIFTVRRDGRWQYSSGGAKSWKLVAYGAPLETLRFGDFDGDGKTDVFTVNRYGRWQYSPGGAKSWKPIASGASLEGLRVQ